MPSRRRRSLTFPAHSASRALRHEERIAPIIAARSYAHLSHETSRVPPIGGHPGRFAGRPYGLTAGHGRQDLHLAALGDGGLQPVGVADVLAVDVDVDEPAQLAALVADA